MATTSANTEDTLASYNRQSLESDDYADFIVTVGEFDFKIHRNIVCPRSPFLKQLCDSKFKVLRCVCKRCSKLLTTYKEAQTGCAKLNETDPVAFEKLLYYVYTGSYTDKYKVFVGIRNRMQESETSSDGESSTDEASTGPGNQSTSSYVDNSKDGQVHMLRQGELEAQFQEDMRKFHLNSRIYIIADFCGMSKLKKQAFGRCQQSADNAEIFQKADRTFITTIHETLTTTSLNDQELRPEILRLCAKHHEQLLDWPALEAVFIQEEPLAWMLAKAATFESEDCSELRRNVGDLKSKLEAEMDKMSELLAAVDEIDRCRNHTCRKSCNISINFTSDGHRCIICQGCGTELD